ncbi:MAG: SDR family oxidoreductase [Gemmatimonadetes bacterium]|nr:SDR family oxidoreductase [Gemmatimonadota bacterium]
MAPSARPLAVVTGASAGLGRVFAQRLAAGGHDVLLVARDAGRLDALAAALNTAHGAACEPWPADLSRDADVDRLVGRLRGDERLAILVNNAGFGTTKALAKADPAGQEAMVRVHCLAPMRLTQAALPGMLARRRGTVINVSSVASFAGSPGNVNYCATKAYLRVFSETLALECAGRGVAVQALCPGFTYTEFHDRIAFDRGRIPAWLWMSAESVIDTSLAQAARGGKTVCIPGAKYKVIVWLLRNFSWVLAPLRGRHRRD